MEEGAGDSETSNNFTKHEFDNEWDDEQENKLLASVEDPPNNFNEDDCNSAKPDNTSYEVVSTSSKENKNKTMSVSVKTGSSYSPQEMFRPLYLCVSDLTKQHWCEQMLCYSFSVPTIQVEDPVLTAGSSLHLARELAVHDIVQVKTTSREDSWAIKILNLLGAVQGFLNGVNLAREVPIFGAPFNHGVFLVGIIDELRFDPESYTIELSELKTRSVRSVPKHSQQKQNTLQVMIYKKLFDDLVKGKLSKEMFANHLKLKLDKPLGGDVLEQCDLKFATARTLEELVDYVFVRIQALTCISQLSIEYVHQETNESLFKRQVEYDEHVLEVQFNHYVQFWQGHRKAEGVDIEDAWKCQRCDFAEICEWREQKAQELAVKNKSKMLSCTS